MLFAFPPQTEAQSSSAVADLAARINRERTARGLVPYALNPQLSSSAQAHANDIAQSGKYSHEGSDGSTAIERIARSGYGAYSWGRRVGENWAWYHDADAAMKMWMESAPHRANILNTAYREFGIGIAPAQNGALLFVVDFGAQPNVLPVFVNVESSENGNFKAALTLSNEEAVPGGDGANAIGRATEVQISGNEIFSGAQWQPYATRLGWTFNSKMVYVRFRDSRGRMATSSVSINTKDADFPAPRIQVVVTPSMTATTTATRPRPTATRTATRPSSTATTAPTETVSATSTGAIEMPMIQPTETSRAQTTRVERISTPTSALVVAIPDDSSIPPILWGVIGIGIVGAIFLIMRLISR